MKKRLLALLLALVTMVSVLPVQAFAAAEPEYLPLGEVDENLLTDGMFYLGSAGAEIPENAGHGYLLKVVRYGSADSEAKVRLTMLGQTASYGTDYTVSLYGGGLFEGGVENRNDAKSMLDVIQENPDDVDEYNYSDAVIDGTVEEQETLTDEEQTALESEAEAFTEALLDGEMEARAAAAPEKDESEDAPADEEEAEVVLAEPEERELSLAEAKELATGLAYDKEPMTGGDAALVAPYLTSQTEALNEELQSAYMVLTFKPGQTEKYIEITPKDNDQGAGNRMAYLNLTAEENAEVFDAYSAFTLTLIDDEDYEPAMVQFSQAEYNPEDGYATVYIERTGNLTGVFQLYIDTEDGSAVSGVNYSAVHALVQFPFGLTERHVKIPVSSAGLTEAADFTVKLSEPSGCVLGEITETTVTIDPEDKSFARLMSVEDSEEDGTATLMEDSGKVYDLGKKVCAAGLDMSGWPSSSQSNGTYEKWVNDHWEIKVDSDTLKIEDYDAGTYFHLGSDNAIHYDYSGIRLKWARSAGAPAYGGTKVETVNDRYTTLYESSQERWDQRTDNVLFQRADIDEVHVRLIKGGGMWGKDPTLSIYSAEPIYRPFAVTLRGPDTYNLKLVVPNNDGGIGVSELPASQIAEYKGKCEVLLDGATNTGTGTLYTHADMDITVALKETSEPIFDIVGIQLVNTDNFSVYDIPNVKTNGTSASFRLDNEFLSRFGTNSNYINYSDYSDSNGITGSFVIQPVLASKTVTLKINKSTKGSVLPMDSSRLKVLSEDETSVTYQTTCGDYVRFTVNVGSQFRQDHVCLGLRDASRGIIFDTLNYNTSAVRFKADRNMELTPLYQEGENAVVVRVSASNLSKFDTTRGIFTCPCVFDGSSYYYTVADSTKTIPFQHYELEAYPLDDAQHVSMWTPSGNVNTRYLQNIFPFEAQLNRSDNVVSLSWMGREKKWTNQYSARIYLDSGNGAAPLEGATFGIDRTFVGVSGKDGKVTTPPYRPTTANVGNPSYFRRYTVTYQGNQKYVDGKLSTLGFGGIVFSFEDLQGPYISCVTSENENGVYSSKIDIDDNHLVKWKATVNYRGANSVQGIPYLDSDGVQRYEKAKEVEFVVVDPVTKEEKSTYKATVDPSDPTLWTARVVLNRGNRNEYSSSDLLYARLITDRVQGNGTAEDAVLDSEGNFTGEYEIITPAAMQETVYPLKATNLYFAEANPTVPVEQQITVPNLSNLELPIIGSLMMNMNIKGFNLGISELPNNVLRLSFGVVVGEKGSRDNKETDTGVYDDASWANMASRVNTQGSRNKLGAMSLGIPVWKVSPFAGIYIDFELTYNQTSGESDYEFIGAGITLGLTGYLRYTYYIIVYGIPFYVGGDVTATLLGQLGFQGDSNLKYTDALTKAEPLDDVDLDASIRAQLIANAYAGVGICGTLGVRGGFSLNLKFIYAPTVQRTYPQFRDKGFKADGAIKFWADLVLFSIPIPVYSGNLAKMGYFEDLETLRKDGSASLMSVGSEAEMAGTPVPKPRSGVPSSFVANDARLMSTFSPVDSKDLVKGNFDAPSPQIMSLCYEKLNWNEDKADYDTVYSVGQDTYLLVYLDDDTSRTNPEDRTALMWSWYNGSTWSTPQKVQDDGTADLYPNLCDMGDKVAVTWASRSKTGMENQADFVSSMEIYTAFFDKTNHSFGEITRLTDDSYYDYAPVAVYDSTGADLKAENLLGTAGYEGGDLIVYYMKAQVNEQNADKVLETTMNPTLNSAEVLYRIYDGKAGQWVTERKSENESISSAFPNERFVSSPVSIGITSADPEKGNIANQIYNNPVIVDFNAMAGYDLPVDDDYINAALALEYANSSSIVPALRTYHSRFGQKVRPTAFYAFTVDADNDMDTDWDRELYIQMYDFADHKTGAPIRITDNDVCDSNPQLIYGADDDVFLFWLEDGNTVRVMNLTGKLLDNNMRAYMGRDDTALAQWISAMNTAAGVNFNFSSLDTAPDWTPGFVAVGGDTVANPISSFTAFVDQDENLYVAYPRVNADGVDICVTGYVPLEDPNEGFNEIGTWSDPVCMTDGSEINELPVMAAKSDGTLLMVNNRYQTDLSQDAYNTKETHIVETTYKTVGSLEVTDVQVDSVPAKAGDEFTATVTLRNTGVKPSKGITYSGRLLLDGNPVATIEETTDAHYLYPTREYTITQTFTLPAGVTDLSKLSLEITAKEGGVVNSQTETVQLYDGKQRYEISGITASQTKDGYELTGTIWNVGSAAAKSGDTIQLRFHDIYGGGKDDTLFASVPVGELGIGESKTFTASYTVSPDKMDVGIINGLATVYNGETQLSEPEEYTMALEFPYEVSVNDHATTITIKEGQTLQLNGSYEGGRRYKGGEVTIASNDPSIATVDESGVLMGISEGETTLALSVDPFGGSGTVTVKVTPASTTPGSPSTPTTTEITVEVSSDEGSVSVTAKVSGNTATITAPTDAQMEEILGKSRDTGAVTIDLSSLPETVTAASIPAETIKAISEAMETGGEGLTIKLPNSTVTFDPEALASIAEQTTGKDLKLNVDPITESKLNAKQKEALADLDVQAVYDIYLTSDGKRITNFGGGKATVQVTYQVKDGQQPGGIEVWYVADEGGKTWIPTTATADSVTFTVTQFSNYVLTYDETLPGACAKDDNCPMTPFTDLDKSKWYHDGVHWALENSVMNGVGNNKFDPNGSTSRAMIVTMLYRMEGEPEVTSEMTFDDVPTDTWYTNAVAWAEANGIVNGVGNNKFAPTADLTREQLVTILQRYANYKGIDTSEGEMKPLKDFDDTRYISDWAVKAFRWAVDAGIINGTGNGKISPKTDASRAQVATMLMRYDSITQ